MRKTALVTGLLLALFPVTTWADDPTRRFPDRSEIVSDPKAEAEAAVRFGVFERDQSVPGEPITAVAVMTWHHVLDEEGVGILARLYQLRTFAGFDLSTAQVRSLVRLPQLKELLLDSWKTSADDLKALVPLTGLHTLTLNQCKLTAAGLKELTALEGLERLCLDHCEGVNDAGVKHLTSLKHLTLLSLRDSKVTDTGLTDLATLQWLETLDLNWCSGVTGRGLKALARCPRLQNLYLGKCSQLTAADFHELRGLKVLRELDVSECRLNDKDVAALAELKSLERLTLRDNNDVTDEGLRPIANLKRLQHLDLTKCDKLTDKVVSDLKAALPHCTVIGPHVKE